MKLTTSFHGFVYIFPFIILNIAFEFGKFTLKKSYRFK